MLCYIISMSELEMQPSRPRNGVTGKTTCKPAQANGFSTLHELLFMATLVCAQIFTQVAFAQGIVPFRIIGEHFGTESLTQTSWYASSFSLTVGSFILVAGRLGDMYGHRRMYIGAFCWLAFWSLLAGVSFYSNQLMFEICRAFQGIGPAFLLPNGLAILGRTYPDGTRRNMFFSFFGAAAPTGFLIGAVFSGLFAQLVWWSWAFWVYAIACVFMAILSYFVIPICELEDDATQGFDYAGAFTGIAALILINVAWNQGPNIGWSTPYVYVLLIIGILFAAAFVYIELHVKWPLVPIHAFQGETGFVLACIASGWACFGIWVYYLWLFMEVLQNKTPLTTAAEFVSGGISGVCAAVVTGYIMGRIPTSYIMILAMLAFITGTILAATMPVQQTYWAQLFCSFVIMPWGMDMSFPAGTLILSSYVPKKHQGIAASLVTTVVNYSIAIGLGIGGTVESRVNRDGTETLKGYRSAWYTGIGLGAVGLIISLIAAYRIRRRRIN